MTESMIFISIVCATAVFLGGHTVYQNHFYLNNIWTKDEKRPLRDVVGERHMESKWRTKYIETTISLLSIGWPIMTIAFIVMHQATSRPLGIWISLIGLALTALVNLVMRKHIANLIRAYAVIKMEEEGK